MRHRLAAITLGAALGVGTLTASAAQAAPVTEANLAGARCVAAGVSFRSIWCCVTPHCVGSTTSMLAYRGRADLHVAASRV